jgi:MFS family permease
VVLLAVVGISYLGLGFIFPLYSLYAREVIGASSAEIGIMASAFLVTGFFTAPAAGWLSDRFGQGRVLWIALAAHSLLMLGYILADTPEQLIALRALEGVAATGVLPAARALMNEIAPSHRQGEALGLLSAAQMAGILLGPAAGAFLASQVGFAPSFVVSAGALGLVAISVVATLPSRGEAPTEAVAGLAWRDAFQAPLTLSYGLRLILSVPQGMATAIWSLYMADRGASLPLVGLSFTAFALPTLLAAPAAGRLSDRHGRYWPALAGIAVSGIIYSVYGLPLSPAKIIVLSMAEGAAAAVARSAVDGLLADSIPPAMKGRVQANFTAAGTAGRLCGAAAAGILYGVGPGLPFLAEGILFLVVAASLLLQQGRRARWAAERR